MCSVNRTAAILDKYPRGNKPAAKPRKPKSYVDDWYQTKPRGSKLGNGGYIWRG